MILRNPQLKGPEEKAQADDVEWSGLGLRRKLLVAELLFTLSVLRSSPGLAPSDLDPLRTLLGSPDTHCLFDASAVSDHH